jgi:8-oxo-dGTP pyrophosphatase MutT (NUDIX family)
VGASRGGLDFGENIEDAIIREVFEETGIKVKSISQKPIYIWTWKFENKRNIDWYYSLVLCYKVELESFDFKTTDECEDIRFFSKEELSDIELCYQTNGLKNYFNPQDFI